MITLIMKRLFSPQWLTGLALLLALIEPSSQLSIKERADAPAATQGSPKYVTAHFMVGIVENYTIADWKVDMKLAKDIGVDAFALNCASIDWYTPKQLANAYEAASQADFKVFISFDFAYWTNGDTAKITSYMQNYSSHPAQLQYNGAALASTFVGDSFDWGPVKRGTQHPILAVPHLQDPGQLRDIRTSLDGAFSWYAWPTDGGNSVIPGPMTTIWDDKYIQNLGGRVYMAPVSPWFSTHFNTKNWVFICEDLITVRWEQMLKMKPQLIEIISWNDYGESHYIGPYSATHSDDGSSQWAKGFPHDAWRLLSAPYIAAYKAGASTPEVKSDQLVYWYRPTPKDVKCSRDSLGPPRGVEMLADRIFVTTMLTKSATLTVTSGAKGAVSADVGAGVVTRNFTMGVGPQSFSVSRGGKVILAGKGGLDIKDQCEYYNYNVYVGSVNGTTA